MAKCIIMYSNNCFSNVSWCCFSFLFCFLFCFFHFLCAIYYHTYFVIIFNNLKSHWHVTRYLYAIDTGTGTGTGTFALFNNMYIEWKSWLPWSNDDMVISNKISTASHCNGITFAMANTIASYGWRLLPK